MPTIVLEIRTWSVTGRGIWQIATNCDIHTFNHDKLRLQTVSLNSISSRVFQIYMGYTYMPMMKTN